MSLTESTWRLFWSFKRDLLKWCRLLLYSSDGFLLCMLMAVHEENEEERASKTNNSEWHWLPQTSLSFKNKQCCSTVCYLKKQSPNTNVKVAKVQWWGYQKGCWLLWVCGWKWKLHLKLECKIKMLHWLRLKAVFFRLVLHIIRIWALQVQ